MQSNSTEIWQVAVGGEVYQADLEILKQWIREGAVAPTDKVTKGNRAWIDAERAPALRRVFLGEEPPLQPETMSGDDSAFAVYPADSVSSYSATDAAVVASENYQTAAAWQSYETLSDAAHYATHQGDYRQPDFSPQADQAPFGFSDFSRAVTAPFRNPVALVGLCILYSLFVNIGLIPRLLAFGLLFGCMSQVINRGSQGLLDKGILNTDDFEFFNDVIAPIGRGIAVSLVSFAPLLLVFVFIVFSLGAQMRAYDAQHEAAREQVTADQAAAEKNSESHADPEEQKALARLDPRLAPQTAPTANGETNTDAESDTPPDDETSATRESVGGRANPLGGFASVLTATAGLYLLLIGLALLWALFYYPMALTVAGYTESFLATLNPLVGLDTMRRMGGNYVKAFVMYVVVSLAGAVTGVALYKLLAPLDMPLVGNLPASFLSSWLNFYASMVVAGILGLALFKSSDRLQLPGAV